MRHLRDINILNILPLTPNTRQWKYALAKEITEVVDAFGISKSDQVDVLTLSLKQLNIFEQIKFASKPTEKGRKLLKLPYRESVWNLWHMNSFESTNSNQIAKLRVTDKNRIQDGLEFAPSVITIQQRNRSFYQSIYKIVEPPFKTLYQKYIRENPEYPVSWGTFFTLKPFYVRHTTLKDIEMCCCRQHLHARCWSIDAFAECSKKHGVVQPFFEYEYFFKYMYGDCQSESRTHISWECTPNDKSICRHMRSKWESIKDSVKNVEEVVNNNNANNNVSANNINNANNNNNNGNQI